MAQWLGQFTGNSHATKVKDLEETLVHAVTVLRQTSAPEEIQAKRKSVLKLAEKLLIARLKFLKAKIYAAEPVSDRNTSKQQNQLENLRQSESKVRSEGVEGILVEFGAENLFK